MANTVLESQNSLQTTVHRHSQTNYTNPPVQHRSFRTTVDNQYGSKYSEATFPPALPYWHCKRDFYSDDPFDSGNTKRPARPAPCLDHFNGMLIGLKRVSSIAGDNFQNVIICEGTFIDRYRLIGGIISL